MSTVAIRPAEAQDISGMLQIQASSPEAAQWQQSAYENVDSAGKKCWVAERDGKLAGFLVARVAAGEMEILNLAVAADVRRGGIGTALLQEALSWGASRGAKRVFLEVRASNDAARRFYERHGFASTGVRPRYYGNPVEDALVLSALVGEKTTHG